VRQHQIAEGGCMAMTTRTEPWTEEIVEVAGTRLQLVKGGSGEPLLILHDELGHPGWLRFHEALAQRHSLYIPSHPGFGKSDGLEWIMNMRDMAGWYLDALDELGLGPLPAVGFSLGGWLAAVYALPVVAASAPPAPQAPDAYRLGTAGRHRPPQRR